MVGNIEHCVAEPTSLMRYNRSPVGHGVELIEPTGLEPAGHHQEVGCCSDLVGHWHVEANVRPHLQEKAAQLHISSKNEMLHLVDPML